MNNSLTLVIIEDEFKVAQALKMLIERVLPEHKIQSYPAETIQTGVELIKKHQPDLVFSDIRLSEEPVFQLFKHIDTEAVKVVFTTAYNEYMSDSVNKYGCFGYLLKPVDQNELKTIFERYENLNKPVKQFSVKVNEKYILIQYSNIIYFKASGSYCDIYTQNKKYRVSLNMGKTAVNIPKNFVRVHHSIILNMDYLSSYDKKNMMLHLNADLANNALEINTAIPVGKKYRNEVNDYLP